MAEGHSIGCAQRRLRPFIRRSFHRPEPNYWRVDGYDKLKPYGLAIHGYVDVISRPVMWLKVGYTNNILAWLPTTTLSACRKLSSVPKFGGRIVGWRTEPWQQYACSCVGTLLGVIGVAHPSPIKLRIECFWPHLRGSRVGFLCTLFKGLVGNDQLDLHGILDMCCWYIYAFTEHVQHKVDLICKYWNTHRIRYNRE